MEANKKKANEYCARAAKAGAVPLAPHTIFTQYLDDNIPSQRRQGLEMGLELLRRCEELWVCGGVISEGMRGEIAFAKEHGIAIRYFPCPEAILENRDSALPLVENHIYTNHNGSDYLCKSISDSNSAVMERIKDGWTLTAHGIQKYADGTIEWDYSTGGRWVRTSLDEKLQAAKQEIKIGELRNEQKIRQTERG